MFIQPRSVPQKRVCGLTPALVKDFTGNSKPLWMWFLAYATIVVLSRDLALIPALTGAELPLN